MHDFMIENALIINFNKNKLHLKYDLIGSFQTYDTCPE
jgi:hypothetical protein